MGTLLANKENAGLATLQDQATRFIGDSISANTRRGYLSDFRQFVQWCEARGLSALPAATGTVSAYFTHLAESGKKAATIDRAKAAIRWMHEERGEDDPTNCIGVRKNLKGIRRNIGTAKTKKSPTLCNDICAMADTLPDNLLGLRDRALLLVGFAGGFRRSELAGIELAHIEECTEGIRILIPRSKTDQEGEGRYVGIERSINPDTCPVRALMGWITAAGIVSGPVFRRVDRHGNVLGAITPQVVALVVKRVAIAAGLDATRYSGHSLRAGCVTQAYLNDASVIDIMRQTGHKSQDTVNGYIRPVSIFQNNVSGKLGL